MRFSAIFIIAIGWLLISKTTCAQRKTAFNINERIYFDTSDYHLDEHDKEVLSRIHRLMESNPGVLLQVIAHTDSLGQASYNLKLSEKRGLEVVNYLVSLGTARSRLFINPMGQTKPVILGGKYNLQASRRVEFKQFASIKGQLLNENNQPIEGEVLLLNPYTKSTETVTIEKDGKFSFEMPFRDLFILYSFSESYISGVDSLRLSVENEGGSDLNIKITLHKAMVKDKLVFDNIYFAPGNAEIASSSMQAIDKIHTLMMDEPEIFIEIQGHVSQPDRDKLDKQTLLDGKELSFKRAESIAKELMKRGISPARIKYRGMGSEKMLFPMPATDDEDEQNRRVEIIILRME